MNKLFLHLAALAVILTLAACNKQEAEHVETQRREQGQKSPDKAAVQIVGPIEIPRVEISTKYGWDEQTLTVPVASGFSLVLEGGSNAMMISVPKEGISVPRFKKVGNRFSFSGKNLRIGNLVFEGSFTWSDKKITLLKDSKMHQ